MVHIIMDKFISRLQLIGKEILNVLTNIVIPVWGVVMIVAEIFGLPASSLEVLKKIEYALFAISGTKDVIEQSVEEK